MDGSDPKRNQEHPGGLRGRHGNDIPHENFAAVIHAIHKYGNH